MSKKEKRKVWTRLSNGLYGWRKKCIPKKYLGPEADVGHSSTEQVPPSISRKHESQGVPAKGSILFKTLLQEIKSNNKISDQQTGSCGVKRKQNFNFGEGSCKLGKESKSLDLGMELEISESNEN